MAGLVHDAALGRASNRGAGGVASPQANGQHTSPDPDPLARRVSSPPAPHRQAQGGPASNAAMAVDRPEHRALRQCRRPPATLAALAPGTSRDSSRMECRSCGPRHLDRSCSGADVTVKPSLAEVANPRRPAPPAPTGGMHPRIRAKLARDPASRSGRRPRRRPWRGCHRSAPGPSGTGAMPRRSPNALHRVAHHTRMRWRFQPHGFVRFRYCV